MIRRALHLALPALFLSLMSLSACAPKAKTPRCLTCGMRADADPRFQAGGTLEGEEVFFDTPKCLFRLMESGKDVKSAWAVDYYSGERRALGDLRFVVGSSVLGPMGDDLVPISGSADIYIEDHGGRVVERAAIDKALLDELH